MGLSSPQRTKLQSTWGAWGSTQQPQGDGRFNRGYAVQNGRQDWDERLPYAYGPVCKSQPYCMAEIHACRLKRLLDGVWEHMIRDIPVGRKGEK